MKLLALEFQAFGPFVEKQKIDFTILNDKGMFLINGPTGTGKTTIFDAVTFALYGKGSGKDRDDGKSLRSDYANEEDITYVDLTFEANGKTYRIYRQAARLRKKKSGEGNTEEPMKVDLYMPNGSVVSKIKEVDNKIVNEILFIDRNQFKSVALLAQGEFTELITADSKSRAAILEHIFQKEIYTDFQNSLTAMAKSVEGQLNIVQSSLNTLVVQIEDGDKIACYNEALADPSNVPNFIEKVEEYIDQLEEEYKECKEKTKEAHSAFQDSTSKLGALKSTNEQIEKYTKALVKKDELIEQSPEIEAAKKTLETQLEIDVISPLFKSFDTLSNSKRQNEETIKESNEKLKAIETTKDYLKNNKLKYDENKKRYAELNKIIPTLKSFVRERTSLKADKNILEEKQKDYDDAISKNKKKEKEFLDVKNRFFASSSYNLAKELEEGQPCPVCGSTHHPEKAHVINPVSEAEYKKAEAEYNSSNNQLTSKKSQLDSSKAAFEQKESSMVKLLKDNGFGDANKGLIYSDKIDNKITELSNEQTSINSFNNEYDKKQSQVLVDESKYKQAIESANKSIENLIKQISEANNDIDNKLNNNVYIKSRETYQEKTAEAKNAPRLDIERIKKQIEKYKADVISAETIINNTPNELIEKGLVDEASFVEENNCKKIVYEELNTTLNNIENKIKNLNQGVNSVKKKYEECKEIISKCTSLQELAKTANGANRMKLSFKMYILADYFDKIIAQANRRLLKITNGRYHLIRSDDLRKGNAQQGLDLDVFDIETGKARPAQSLSGGEKFVSALSLALGLSDIIETNHALIQVESIFIDEGFGTLDEAYLDTAMKALESLKGDNKTVAIISHVEKLKSYIPDSLVVKKTTIGSTITMETRN